MRPILLVARLLLHLAVSAKMTAAVSMIMTTIVIVNVIVTMNAVVSVTVIMIPVVNVIITAIVSVGEVAPGRRSLVA